MNNDRYPEGFLDQYKIEGAINTDDHYVYSDKNSYPNFQLELQQFKDLLIELVRNGNEPKTFYKFGDGDGCFLRKDPSGSAAPGTRALSLDYSKIKHEEFTKGAQLNDFYTCELYPQNRESFGKVINKNIDFPAEFSYGLIANKWLTKTFSGEVGLIGAKEKLIVIEELMKYKEYQEYLGLEKFEDYIHIPQKFACDNIDETEAMVAKQLEKSTSKIFLLGIGHVKSALLHRLKKYKNAIYLDVGSGIDAIASMIVPWRPYAGGWVNHQLSDDFYTDRNLDIDFLNWRGDSVWDYGQTKKLT